jgi:hypothetical protein
MELTTLIHKDIKFFSTHLTGWGRPGGLDLDHALAGGAGSAPLHLDGMKRTLRAAACHGRFRP